MKKLKLQFFTSFFIRLSKRERTIFYVAACFIMLTAFDRLIIDPIYAKIASLDRDIKDKETNIKKDLYILSLKDRILSESAKYAPFLNRIEFGEKEVASLLKEIETVANKSTIYLIDIKPQGTKEVGGTQVYTVSVNFEAQMEQLIDFMYNIESSNEILLVGKYQISPKSKESSVATCGMLIYKIIM